jgi:hypothetical protein
MAFEGTSGLAGLIASCISNLPASRTVGRIEPRASESAELSKPPGGDGSQGLPNSPAAFKIVASLLLLLHRRPDLSERRMLASAGGPPCYV